MRETLIVLKSNLALNIQYLWEPIVLLSVYSNGKWNLAGQAN